MPADTDTAPTLDDLARANERVRVAHLHVRHLQSRGLSTRKCATAKRELRAARAALRALDTAGPAA